MKFTVQLIPEEEGGYSVVVPGLPGCVSQGETREEALSNIQEAITLYLGAVDELTLGSDAETVVVELKSA